MQDVVIVGAGGLGREISEWIEDLNEVRPMYRLVGFLDDNPAKHSVVCHGVPILGGLDWVAGRDIGVVLGVGSPPFKRLVVERLRGLGVSEFPSIVHPRAVVGRHVVIGEGTVICPGAIVTTDVRMGAFVCLNFDLSVGHDCQVDDYVTLSPGVHLSGYVTVGEGSDLGAGAVALPSIHIGPWSIVGAGAVVTEDLPANCTAVGVPARAIKHRPQGWQLHL